MPAPAPTDLATAAVTLTGELVAIDSVNPGLVPGAPGERAVVEHLARRLREGPWAMAVVPADDPADRPSLLAWSEPRAAGPVVVLTGHLDTVGVEAMADPFSARVDGDRLHGRGACDMLGGVAALVVVAEELTRRRWPGQVVLALVADEEDRSLGTEAVLRALPSHDLQPDVCVVAEPTWLARTETLRGYAVVETVLTGRAAHSSQPQEGVNAVTHLGRLLAAVEEAGRAVAAGGGSLMATVASGGTAPFTLAGRARAVIERRTVPGEPADVLAREVDDIVARLVAADPTVHATSTLRHARPAWRLDTSGAAAELADLLDAALRTATGVVRPPLHAPYWMEAPLWQEAGIPALVCGPAGGGLHAADEWVDLAEVRSYADALVAALVAFADGWGPRAD